MGTMEWRKIGSAIEVRPVSKVAFSSNIPIPAINGLYPLHAFSNEIQAS